MTSPYSTGVVGTYPISGNSQIDPLVWLGYKWGSSGAGTSASVTYSFPTYNATWSGDYSAFLDNEPFDHFQPFTAAQQIAAKQALALWSDVANITFTQVDDKTGDTDVGDIRFGNSGAVTNSTSAAWAYTPFDDGQFQYPENGDVWFDVKYAPNLQLQPSQFGFSTMLHEIGHAIGLDHPFQDDPNNPNEPVLGGGQDIDSLTVMSYTAELTTMAYASSPQMLDILAIQYIYGANMTTRAGDDVYKFSASTEVNKTIWDAGGNDTLDFSNQGGSVNGNMVGGQFFRFGGHPAFGTSSILGIAYGVTIENVIGSNGGNNISGNAAANRMIGGNGNDSFDGHEGDDHLEGRAGGDMLVAGDGNNWVDGGAGVDGLYAGMGVDTLLGGAGNDYLNAFENDDLLDGGSGSDVMVGGQGNDTYVIDSAGDVIEGEEFNFDGDDAVRSTITINLLTLDNGAIENATLLGAAAINATGNDKDNDLTGNAGANALDGGVGADIMTGGNGADTYNVDNLGDQVIETNAAAAGGIDLVKSTITLSLAAFANVESLTLALGAGNIDATGNTGNNVLTGNEGANVLDGGLGKDVMTGGKGDDIYVVDSTGDVVNETVLNINNGGTDKVESSITFSLATRTNIENLELTAAGNINGTGNALANLIQGNAGNNILDGGIGADTLKGGAGNDTYILDNLGDVVDEEGNADIADEVKTSVLIAATIAGVENYTYTGAKAWSFTGDSANNKITGGAGNDALTGLGGNDWLDGGAGKDKMMGGAGNDTYVINVVGDSIDEEGNADLEDLVRSLVTVDLATLAAGAIENAILLGAAAINAFGNDVDNDLTGNAGANILDGRIGADTMTGGNGADTYWVDNAGDQVIETTAGAAGGIDLVKSGITYSLAALLNVENLTLLAGAGDINATGNDKNNVLIGNEGANILDGGLGNDTMTGGAGGDTYIVNVAGDIVNETVLNINGGGVDTVMSAVTFTLATRTNIEHLTLTGSANINGTGNALDNQITGNDGKNTIGGGTGNDTLDGGKADDTLIGGIGNDFLHGGEGIDKLTGGVGSDTFDFNTIAEAGDTIVDFKLGAGGDVLNLADLIDSFGDPADPFGGGYLSFDSSLANTLVRVDADGGSDGFVTLVTLLNVHLTSADTSNFMV